MAEGWRYYAYRLNGDGTETLLYPGLILTQPKLDVDLSGPGSFNASITPEQAGLAARDGSPLFVPWSTALYAEKDGQIRNGGIFTGLKDQGAELKLECVGFTGYAGDQPYTDDNSWVGEDPLNIVRHIWSHLQTKPGGNIGLQVDATTSPIRIGKPFVEGNTNRDEGPYVLGWWEVDDLGKTIDDLATDTPFDYRVDHEWDGETVRHYLRIGYPDLGRRREDLRFIQGENVFTAPPIDYSGEDYADEVIVLGAGEGRKMIRGVSPRRPNTGRLRRATTVDRKDITDQAAADREAAGELNYRLGDPDIDTIVVTNHPQMGSYGVGDEIQVGTRAGFHKGLDLWVRILSISTDPETNTDELTVIRSEKVKR